MKYLRLIMDNILVVLAGIAGVFIYLYKAKSDEVEVLKTRSKTVEVNKEIEFKEVDVKRAEDTAKEAKETYEEWKKRNSNLLDDSDNTGDS